MSSTKDTAARLVVRNAAMPDITQIIDLTRRAYPNMEPYTRAMIRGHLNNFPEGQFVAEFEGRIVGYCATFRISGKLGLAPHTWKEITGGGFNARHDPNGDYLYGMEVCVDPEYRRMRIGQRFYDERRLLCQYLRLTGIVIGGRMPRLAKAISKAGTPENFVNGVIDRKYRDPTLNFQLRQNFEVVGVLPEYLPADKESLGYAVHMVWNNPNINPEEHEQQFNVSRVKDSIRIASVQYMQRRVESFEEFCRNVEYFVDVVSDYRADFVTFPEYFTFQLLSIENKKQSSLDAIKYLDQYTQDLKNFMNDLSVRYNINIIGGSHPTINEQGEAENISFIFLRDGSVHHQAKIHPTPDEKYWWNIKGGSELEAIDTDCGPVGVLICYDSEFPELCRHLANQGVQILFVPFCTSERQGFLRVRYSCHARAIENQIYVALSGNCGNLPGVENMDIQYAQSCILTPCDFNFARDGIAADTTPNVEMVAVADLRLDSLMKARNSGAVQNLKDRRFDLYSVQWHKNN